MSAVRRDEIDFPTREEAQFAADALNQELPPGAETYFVINVNPHAAGGRGDLFYVVAPDGTKVRNPKPVEKVNPFGNQRPDNSFGTRDLAQAEADRRNAGLETPQFVVMQHRVYGHFFVVDPRPPVFDPTVRVQKKDPNEILKPARGGIDMVPGPDGHTHYTGQRRHGFPK